MITTLKNKTPAIDFGFGITNKTITAGQPVTIWLNTIYGESNYSIELNAPETATVTTISNYEYQITLDTPGEYIVSITAVPKTKKPSLESNILKLTVV